MHKGSASIYVHNKHSGHLPGSENDKFFLPIHPIVIDRAMEDLKRMVSSGRVSMASLKDEDHVKECVSPLERATFRFSLIPKEVEQMAYYMRIKG